MFLVKLSLHLGPDTDSQWYRHLHRELAEQLMRLPSPRLGRGKLAAGVLVTVETLPERREQYRHVAQVLRLAL